MTISESLKSMIEVAKPLKVQLMEKILHHLGCPKCWFYPSIKTFSGILSGAGFFPSTVAIRKRIHHNQCSMFRLEGWKVSFFYRKKNICRYIYMYIFIFYIHIIPSIFEGQPSKTRLFQSKQGSFGF